MIVYEELPHEPPLRSARCLEWVADARLIAYELLPDVTPVGELGRLSRATWVWSVL